MNHAPTTNTIYIGSIAGLITFYIYSLDLSSPSMTILVQFGAVLALGLGLGYYFRKKLTNPYAVTIYSMLTGYGVTRVLPFVNAYWPIIIALFITLGTVGAYFLWMKYFKLKINSTLKYGIASLLIVTWWLIIPLVILYSLRVASMPQ